MEEKKIAQSSSWKYRVRCNDIKAKSDDEYFRDNSLVMQNLDVRLPGGIIILADGERVLCGHERWDDVMT